MEDWIGLGMIVVLMLLAFICLKVLSKETKRTEEEFEKGAAEGASTGGAFLSAVNGMLNPGAKRGDKAAIEIKQGARLKKRADGNENAGTENEEKND